MRILMVGAGKAGSAIHELLAQRGHDIVTVGRKSGDIRCDVSDPTQLDRLWAEAGDVDAVVGAAGETKYAQITELQYSDYLSALTNKALAQINLVRTVSPTSPNADRSHC
ncbi:NAD-dependent epimerase/dehydratase family protein [Rhodococcus qingshengii]|uniref:NAD-dependent epimerase/dehydratase family protein n=1 Tax=Rhodococcus qingshengii TaxID=334542 RepID=UPI0036DBB0BD